MIGEGERAPAVSLPAYAEGEREVVDLGEYLGEGIVVLAFYPGDFNPACSMRSSDLGDLDLFTMQKDVSVFGVSPDSTYSHEAFAERYSLSIPLLSDADGAAAAAYDVELTSDLGEELCQRAVFVVDHRGTVQYAWATDDLEERIDVDPVKRAVGDIGGDETALERYRAAHEEYAAGREAFTGAMAEYEDREWIPARGGFEEAEPAFTAAADHLDTAVRFAETPAFETVADRAEEKADTLQHAASWLADSADALASGRGKKGTEYRDDAERLLDEASDLPEPPAPDQFTLTDDGLELDESIVVDPDDEGQAYAWRADDAEAVDTNLGIDDDDLDAAVDAEGPGSYDREEDDTVAGDTVEGDLEMDLDAVDAAEADDEDDAASSIEGDTVEGDLEMDLDAIDEARTDADDDTDRETGSEGTPRDEAASPLRRGAESASETGPAGEVGGSHGETAAEEGEDGVGDDGDGDGDDDEVVELDLADPTAGDDEDEAESGERANWDIPGQ